MVNESSFEIGIKPVMGSSRQVLVKLVLFQLDGSGHSQDSAMSSFFLGSRGSLYIRASYWCRICFIILLDMWLKLKKGQKRANIYGGSCINTKLTWALSVCITSVYNTFKVPGGFVWQFFLFWNEEWLMWQNSSKDFQIIQVINKIETFRYLIDNSFS